MRNIHGSGVGVGCLLGTVTTGCSSARGRSWDANGTVTPPQSLPALWWPQPDSTTHLIRPCAHARDSHRAPLTPHRTCMRWLYGPVNSALPSERLSYLRLWAVYSLQRLMSLLPRDRTIKYPLFSRHSVYLVNSYLPTLSCHVSLKSLSLWIFPASAQTVRPWWRVTLSRLFFYPSPNLGYATQCVHSTNFVLHRTELTNETWQGQRPAARNPSSNLNGLSNLMRREA